MASTERDWLRPRNVSEWLGIPEDTLKYWRQTGGGPPYRKRGRAVWYHRQDIERWLRAAPLVHSAAEARVLGEAGGRRQ